MTLQQIGEKYGTDKATYHKYCDFYQRHLPGRNECISLLEIGIKDGASLKMWREFYGRPCSTITGIDIQPAKHINDCFVYQMDQSNNADLFKLVNMRFHFNIIIDDGSHMTSHQQSTFGFFFHRMDSGDVYIIEDIHTSEWEQYRDTELTTEKFVRNVVPQNWPVFVWQNPDNPGDSKTMLIIKP